MKNLSEETFHAVRGTLGLEEDDESKDELIRSMDARNIVRRYAQSHLGDKAWGIDFIKVVGEAYGIDFAEDGFKVVRNGCEVTDVTK